MSSILVNRVGLAAAVAAAMLVACADGDDDRLAAEMRAAEAAAARQVQLEQIPELRRCLGALSLHLREPRADAESAEPPSLACLVGTYKGKTTQGEPCSLQINAPQRRFLLSVGATRSLAIDWGDVAVDAQGRPVHNLEAADLDAVRPGVQLRRFTAVPEALTETLALQAGPPEAGPQIHYTRVQGGRVEDLACWFGA